MASNLRWSTGPITYEIDKDGDPITIVKRDTDKPMPIWVKRTPPVRMSLEAFCREYADAHDVEPHEVQQMVEREVAEVRKSDLPDREREW